MDDMTLLRRMRAEIPRPDSQGLAAGRERMLAGIGQRPDDAPARSRGAGGGVGGRKRDAGAAVSTGPLRPRLLGRPVVPLRPRLLGRPVVRAVLATAVVAAVVGGAVVVVGAIREERPAAAPGPVSPRLRPVSAATVLKAAAATERRHEKRLAPRDDQFIYTKEVVRETETTTGRTRTFVDENWRSVDGSQRGWTMEVGKGWWSQPLKPNESIWPPARWQELKKLPTDPAGLVLTVRKQLTGGRPAPIADIRAQDWPTIEFGLVGLLHRTPVMPPGLRAAAFEALGMVPGVTATAGVTDTEGRAGIAIAYQDPFHQLPTSDVLIFADNTYDFLGYADTRTSDSGGKRKTYKRTFTLESHAIVDKVKQRP
ncbi:CU044_5270 family protein [Streptomyces collinus]|uniref:CU044_5270 family protein n=1 Tax=Streptomyces collinus TaxID=42684 RepID=UPI0034374442